MSDTGSSQPPESSAHGKPAPTDSTATAGPIGKGSASRRPEDRPTVISKSPRLPTASATDSAPGGFSADMAAGTRLGHFELVDYIGGGGMGKVFRALDTRLGRTVALKILARDQAADLDTLMRFRNEARSAARLNHEGVAQVFFVGEEAGVPFIVFEFVEGDNIRDLLARKGPLALPEALSYTLQVADALAHCAAQGVVHRDIKPSNLLITPGGRTKLIDMGLARVQQPRGSAGDLTASGVTLGTFDYISPEQARDPRNADERSDIYSLGCTLFFMWTGRPPFPEGTLLQKLLQHQGIEPPDIRLFRPDLPEEVSIFLRKMMAKEPHRRYQNASDLREALLKLAEDLDLRPLVTTTQAWIPAEESPISFLRRQAPWVVPVVALLIGVMWLQARWTTPSGGQEMARPSWVDRNRGGLAEASAVLDSGEAQPAATDDDRNATSIAIPPERGDPAEEVEQIGGPTTGPSTPANLTTNVAGSSAARNSDSERAGQPSLASRTGISGHLQSLVLDARSAPALRVESIEAEIRSTPKTSAGISLPSDFDPSARSLTASALPAGSAASGGAGGREPAHEAESPRVLVVGVEGIAGVEGKGESRFATLRAACAEARSGDVVELRYHGRLEEEPLALVGLDLTVRAADGFRPQVVFRPDEIDPIKCPRTMIDLVASRLTWVDVAIDFDIPREIPTDRWSLFGIRQGDSVAFSQCRLTIRNASEQRTAFHRDVSFFRLQSESGSHAPGGDAPVAEPAEIALTDCMVRGEAALLRSAHSQPVHVAWKNGLLVTSDPLLVATGGEVAPHADNAVRIELERVTAIVDGGLCRFEYEAITPYQLPARFRVVGSLLVGTGRVALIDQFEAPGTELPPDRIAWSGQRNVFVGFTEFWSVSRVGSDHSESKDFEAWRSHWGFSDQDAPKIARLEPEALLAPDRPAHALGLKDFSWTNLRVVAGDSETEQTLQWNDIGCPSDLFPEPPLEPGSEESLDRGEP